MKRASFIYNIFSATIFLGAFLLFQIQPIIGKYILPWFGGASFVWITSLLFFQTLLLAGYCYSYLITKLTLHKQFVIHTLLIFTGIIITTITWTSWSSPLTPDISAKLPDTFPPLVQVLQILFISVGLPYFILSITSTLLQRWFSFSTSHKTPYSLYAVSNAGSLLGIATYPFITEPLLTIYNQSTIWSIAFLVFSILIILCTILVFKNNNKIKPNKNAASHPSSNIISKRTTFAWLFFPAVSSILLLSATNQLTQTVAPIPFLWLVPLGLYLLSFILCFQDNNIYIRRVFAYIFLLLIPVIIALLLGAGMIGILAELILYTGLLFCGFMLCHGELYKKKPEPETLNLFYLFIALGSALGASVVALLAPLLLKGLSWEFMLSLFLTSLIAAYALKQDKNTFLNRLNFLSNKETNLFYLYLFTSFFAIMALMNYATQNHNSIAVWRNFYGTLRITQDFADKQSPVCLINGKIIHGCQYTDEKLRHKPTTYYGEKGGMGMAFKSIRKQKKHLRIGVIGLGAGTTAAYGEKGDYIKFYELNPQDIEIAEKYFTYLKDSPARIEIVTGDGRLSMEKDLKEKGSQKFDIITIDAFSDDGIPFHLLTKEAFALYQKHLNPGGIIAIHISSSYLNLKPPMIQLADYYDLHLKIIEGKADGKLNTRSIWALFSSDEKLISTKEMKQSAMDLSKQPTIPLWTDNYSNLFQLLKK